MIEIKHLSKTFQMKDGAVNALKNIDLTIPDGSIYGIIGMSGAGKSTLVRCINFLNRPSEGTVTVDGKCLNTMTEAELRASRRNIGMIFQHFNLLSSRTVFDNAAFPLELIGMDKAKIKAKVDPLLDLVGLSEHRNKYPAQLSGGQKQRVGIARAIALNPEFVVCDEPVSALDVSIQAQVINMFEELQEKLGVAYLFIAHDLLVVHHISDRIAVMYLGRIVEIADSNELNDNPMHPYTQSLLSAVPYPDPKMAKERQRIVLEGDVPSPRDKRQSRMPSSA